MSRSSTLLPCCRRPADMRLPLRRSSFLRRCRRWSRPIDTLRHRRSYRRRISRPRLQRPLQHPLFHLLRLLPAPAAARQMCRSSRERTRVAHRQIWWSKSCSRRLFHPVTGGLFGRSGLPPRPARLCGSIRLFWNAATTTSFGMLQRQQTLSSLARARWLTGLLLFCPFL